MPTIIPMLSPCRGPDDRDRTAPAIATTARLDISDVTGVPDTLPGDCTEPSPTLLAGLMTGYIVSACCVRCSLPWIGSGLRRPGANQAKCWLCPIPWLYSGCLRPVLLPLPDRIGRH